MNCEKWEADTLTIDTTLGELSCKEQQLEENLKAG